MDRTKFADTFRRATTEARDFARKFVEERLPDAMRFRVHLNSSYDRNAAPSFVLFPEDSSPERTLATKDLEESAVIELLWRDGRIPVWIDVAARMIVDDEVTIVEVTAAGRFTDDDAILYYVWTDVPPFGVKGPRLPADYVEGRRFSLFHDAACWSPRDHEYVARHAEKVRFLHLNGPSFDDALLCVGPTFPNVTVLELDGVRVAGRGWSGLERFPNLKFLRITSTTWR